MYALAVSFTRYRLFLVGTVAREMSRGVGFRTYRKKTIRILDFEIACCCICKHVLMLRQHLHIQYLLFNANVFHVFSMYVIMHIYSIGMCECLCAN